MHKSVNNLIKIQNKLNLLENIKNPKIIAVSKTFSDKDIIPLLDYGHKDFGENKIQEAVAKWTEMKNKFSHVKLHMLGKMQTNKVKYLIPLFDYLHSLDNIKLATKIANEQEKQKKRLKFLFKLI